MCQPFDRIGASCVDVWYILSRHMITGDEHGPHRAFFKIAWPAPVTFCRSRNLMEMNRIIKYDMHVNPSNTQQQQQQQTKLLTGWVPVVKIFTTKNRAVRTLWLLFTICMVVALMISISVVVLRYLTYVTVVRLDQRGTQDKIPPPAFTICMTEHNLNRIPPAQVRTIKDWNMIRGVSKPYKGKTVIEWNSATDAVSPIYSFGGHYRVRMRTVPVGFYSLNVTEQVPRPPHAMCTTFELTPTFQNNATFWKMVSDGVIYGYTRFWCCLYRINCIKSHVSVKPMILSVDQCKLLFWFL